jgi:hypothetical protein
MKFQLVLFSTLLIASLVNAASVANWKYEPVTAKAVEFSFTEDDHKALQEFAAKYPVRKIASEPSDDSQMSKQLRTFISEINALGFDSNGKKLPKEQLHLAALRLDELLAGLEADSKNGPADLKFAAAHFVPLRAFKSFVYRMIPVVQQSQALRQGFIDLLQESYADLKIYFPDTEWEVGFVYLTEPFAGSKPQFKNESQVQTFFLTDVSQALINATNLLKDMKIDSAKPLVFDNQLVYGKMSFKSSDVSRQRELDLNRYTWIRQAEVFAAQSRIFRQLYGIYMNAVYNVEKTALLATEMAALYGVEVAKATIAGKIIKPDIMAPTRKDRVELVRNEAFRSAFKKNPEADKYVETAISCLKASVSNGYAAWSILSESSDSVNAILDPGFFKGRKAETQKGFSNITNLLFRGEKTLTSVISGKSVEVDLLNFYRTLPEDSKVLLPTDFDDEASRKLSRNIAGKAVQYRNYSWGRATAWDSNVYANLFPALKNIAIKKGKAEADKMVPEMMRTWTESRGGTWMAEYLLTYVR